MFTRISAADIFPTMSDATRADKYELYQLSVQAPDHEAYFLARLYKHYYGRKPQLLREDFCGAGAVCCEWVKAARDRRAHGIDLDSEPIKWGIEHNVAALSVGARDRIEFFQRDARSVVGEKADVIAALNFSYSIFKTRDELRRYFRAAYQNLARRGVLALDIVGGWETFQDGRSDIRTIRHQRRSFKYVWEQARFDPITHDCVFYIHFQFPDGSSIQRAFAYHWRLWTIPEVREILREAGFRLADVYWEGTNRKTGKGDNVWRKREHGESDPAWIASVVGVK